MTLLFKIFNQTIILLGKNPVGNEKGIWLLCLTSKLFWKFIVLAIYTSKMHNVSSLVTSTRYSIDYYLVLIIFNRYFMFPYKKETANNC